MNILVTGGAGYIGSHTVLALLEAGYDVIIADSFVNSKPTVIDRLHKLACKDFTFVKCELCDKKQVDGLFSDYHIDAVIHFAGLKAVGQSVFFPLEYYRNNLTSTLNLLQAMQDSGVEDFVFSSSATVYGNPDRCPIKETDPLKPATSPYGATKVMIERILQDQAVANKKMRICLLRYFNPIGAHPSGLIGEDPQGVPNNLLPYITQVAIGKLDKLHVYGDDYPPPDGTCIRDYIHVLDLASGHVAALRHLTAPGVSIYNLGTGKGTSVLEMVAAFEKASGVKIPYEISPRRAGDNPTCYADCSKAAAQLGWKARYDIQQMCADSWNWQRQNPMGYPD